MKVKSEDILKPGAVLVVELIDTTTPEWKAWMAKRKRDWARYEARKRKPYKNLVITI